MGYASYIEDIAARYTQFENFIEAYNQSTEKQIDIYEYLQLRREVHRLLEILKPYRNGEIDIIEHKELHAQNKELEMQIAFAKAEQENLKSKINELKLENKKVANYLDQQDTIERMLNKLGETNIKLSQRISQLIEDAKKLENKYAELLFENSSLINNMNRIINSDNWHTSKAKVNEIESLIKLAAKRL